MPTATIVTDEFTYLGRTEAEALGMPTLPIVVIPHPIGQAKPERVYQVADSAFGEMVDALTQPREQLAAEYRGKYAQPKKVIGPKPIFA